MQQPNIPQNNIVELKYILKENGPDGEVLEVMDEQWPFRFMLGAGVTLAAFDSYISALSDGMQFKFLIPAVDAYGLPDPKKHIAIYRDEIVEDHRYPMDNYETGDFLHLKTSEGEAVNGQLIEINERHILVNCNHALVGKDLFFEGQILHVRPPREEELIAKRFIEPSGVR